MKNITKSNYKRSHSIHEEQKIQIKEIQSLMRRISTQEGKSTAGYYNDSIISESAESDYVWDEFAYLNGIMDYNGNILDEEFLNYSLEIEKENDSTIKYLKQTLLSITKMVRVELMIAEIEK